MPFKPMKRRDFERWIQGFGWTLSKASIDWSLNDAEGRWVCTIKISHPGNEVVASSAQKATKKLKERGLKP
jgi:hypothetical protein